ncbi:hypothetical protein KUCAC02_017369, partial [Chaenocephalus aceratus]
SMGFPSRWINSRGGVRREQTDCCANRDCQISQYGEFISWRLTLDGGLQRWSPACTQKAPRHSLMD